MEIMQFLNTRVVPLALIVVMAGLGLSLTPADFRRVIVFPKAAAVGLAAQLIGLPLTAFALGYLLAPSPAIAVGAVILAACPSGVTSNAYSFAARADVALCVTLSAVTSIITVFTIPFLTYFALQTFYEQGQVPASAGRADAGHAGHGHDRSRRRGDDRAGGGARPGRPRAGAAAAHRSRCC